MITDNDVRQSFRKMLDMPDVLTGFLRSSARGNKNYQIDGRIQTQVLRSYN